MNHTTDPDNAPAPSPDLSTNRVLEAGSPQPASGSVHHNAKDI
ncbi:hypothetical protein V6S67_18560 [Arthrobacter sp. Soc17.1.1.1]